ncbi:MAG: ROK family protein [Candidatus Omnitrophica bacterium]|nr:ROK family protein [Candidatus Omnitrophota bacterium]
MSRKFIVGIDLGGTNLRIALLDLKYKIKNKEVLSTRGFRSQQSLISAIVSSINNIIKANNLTKKDILGVGLGLPGPVDAKKGLVHFFPNIPGFREVNLKDILEKKLGLRVLLDNDAKLMALAEYKLGSARGFKNVLCLTLGTGVGGGLIIGGRLYRGLNNASAEIGHIPLNEKGPRCNCGSSACLEAYIGNNRIIRQARRLFKRDISLEELSLKAKNKDRLALSIWHKIGERLGIALAGAVNLLNLDAIVIGGGVANAGGILFDKVRKTLKERAMSVQGRHVKVFKAKLGNNAGLIGAAIVVKEGRDR